METNDPFVSSPRDRDLAFSFPSSDAKAFPNPSSKYASFPPNRRILDFKPTSQLSKSNIWTYPSSNMPRNLPMKLLTFIKTHFCWTRGTTDALLTILAIFFFAICSYITCLANAVVDRINPNNLVPEDQRSVLVDPGMHFTNQFFIHTGLPKNISDTMILVSAICILLRCLSLKSQSFTVLRRALYISGTVYLLRAPTVLMTVLPNPLTEVPLSFLFILHLLLFTRQYFSLLSY